MDSTMSAIADEQLFARMLSLELRRCERTEGHFALVLIDMERLTDSVRPITLEEIGIGG